MAGVLGRHCGTARAYIIRLSVQDIVLLEARRPGRLLAIFEEVQELEGVYGGISRWNEQVHSGTCYRAQLEN